MIKGACNNVRVWLDNATKCQRATQIDINKLLQATFSPGKTIEQSWIQHPTLSDVSVEIEAKHYPTLLDETSHRCKLVLNLI